MAPRDSSTADVSADSGRHSSPSLLILLMAVVSIGCKNIEPGVEACTGWQLWDFMRHPFGLQVIALTLMI